MDQAAAVNAELKWCGSLKWRDGQIKDLGPRILRAFDTAVEGLSEACFEVSGDKIIEVKRVPVGIHSLGSTRDTRTFSLLVDSEQISNYRHRFGFFHVVRTISHELAHQEREKYIPFGWSLTERLVTEGLAQLAESKVHELLEPSAVTDVDRALHAGSNYWQWKLCEFLTDIQDIADQETDAIPGEAERAVSNKWFKGAYEGYGLGTWVVMLHYVEDEDFGRLLQKPTEEFLDVI